MKVKLHHMRMICALLTLICATLTTNVSVAQQVTQANGELTPFEQHFQKLSYEFPLAIGDTYFPQYESLPDLPATSIPQQRLETTTSIKSAPSSNEDGRRRRPSNIGVFQSLRPLERDSDVVSEIKQQAPKVQQQKTPQSSEALSGQKVALDVKPPSDGFSSPLPSVLADDAQPQPAAKQNPPPGESTSPPVEPTATNAPVTETAESAKLSEAKIEERRKHVETGELAEDVKKTALGQYQHAVEMLRRTDEISKKVGELRAEREKGPQLLAEIRSLLEKPPERPEPDVSVEETVSELDQRRLADEERLREAREAFEAWEQRAKARTERKPQMPALIEKTKQQLADARKSLEAKAPDGEVPAVTEARLTEQEAFVLMLQSQLDLYQIEKARYEALSELFPLQRDLLLRNRNVLEKRSEAWKAILLEAGRRETERQAREARRKLQDAHPDLREQAERNAELIQLRTQLLDLLASTRQNLDAIGKTYDRVESDFKSVKDKEERAGLTTAIGFLLRNQRIHLPKLTPYREQRRNAESEMERLQLEQMPLEDERDGLSDTATMAEEIAAKIPDEQTQQGIDIKQMTLSLLNDRKKYLDDLLADYDSCIKELAELDVRSRKLIEITGEYHNYIDERVLWIRSAGLVNLATPQKAFAGVMDVASPERWYQMGKALGSDTMRRLPLTSMLALGVVCLLVLRSRLRNWIKAFGEKTHRHSVVGVLATVSAILLTLAVASVWPIVLWFAGKRLSLGIAGEFGIAVGEALKTTAIVFWTVEVFRQICRTGGIAAKHLKWPEQSVHSLHGKLLTLLMFGLPLVFGVCLTEYWQDGAWSDSLGRMLFVSGMLLLAISIKQILQPNGRVLGEVLQRHHEGWLNRGRRVWYPIAIVIPLLLAGMAIAGFQFTAQQLLIRVELTFWLMIILLVAFTLATRWMMSARRKLALEQARARRELLNADAESQQSNDEPGPKVEEPKIDYSLLSDQMLKLLRAAACVLFLTSSWFIWGEVLPALQVFNRVELWHTTVQIAEEVEISEGKTEERIVTKPKAITVGSLLLAVGFLVLATVASRNIPGLLELSILQRLPMDHGGRNAITTLFRYALTLSGVVLAARTIGIGWSSVQWLLAALTVGLGFGLQEIFANFVSGLIILFERPVRIGDVVTIDGVSGSVSRIQIRATTITDFDRKEYIIPNKEFVTGRVLNWTLSDKTNRIVITVGVAYGSSTELARNLLVKAATEHPLVLEDPAPVATFEGFGDSCLTLLLRCFLPNLDNRLKTITELHEAIDREFKANKLEIAFPQRDIHVRSMVSLPVAMSSSTTQSDQDTQDEERKAA